MKQFLKAVAQGLALVLPLVVTVWVLYWLGSATENFLGDMLRKAVGDDRYYRGMGIGLGLVVALVLGLLARLWLVRGLLGWIERLVRRVPLVKTLYDSVRDLLGFMGGQKKSFTRVVLVRMPNSDYRMLGFVTQESLEQVPALRHMSDRVAVYVSQSCNIGGAILLVPRQDIEEIDMTVADAMRFALTAGVSASEEAAPTGLPQR